MKGVYVCVTISEEDLVRNAAPEARQDLLADKFREARLTLEGLLPDVRPYNP